MCGLQLHVVKHLELKCVKYGREILFDVHIKAAPGKTFYVKNSPFYRRQDSLTIASTTINPFVKHP